MGMREVKMRNGAILKIAPAPFALAKRLEQVLLQETKSISSFADAKDAICTLFGSSRFDEAVMACAVKCTYNGVKIEESLFEDDMGARENYHTICLKVAEENLSPFLKDLYAALPGMLEKLKGYLA